LTAIRELTNLGSGYRSFWKKL